MNEHVLKEVWEWSVDQIAAAVGMIGAVLAANEAAGVYQRVTDIVYDVASRLAEGTTRDPVALGDELHDWLQDNIHEYMESFVFMSWESHHPGGGAMASIEAVDFGGGVVLLVDKPDESVSSGSDLIDVLAVVDSVDGDEAHDLALDFLLRGLVPDYLLVPPTFTRDDIAAIFRAFLDGGSMFTTGWAELAEIVGSAEPLESDDDRARLLDLYLDRALEINSRED